MKTFTLLIIALVLLINTPLHAQLNTATHTVGSGTNQLDLTVTINASLSQVKFEMTGPANAWFGFAFNTTTMTPGEYTILTNVSGGNPAEYLMQNHSAPTLQPVQNLTSITSSTASGRKTYIFYRAINTGDPNDYTFNTTPGTLDIAWAYGTSLSLGYHASRGDFGLTFSNPCGNTQPTMLPTLEICQGDSTIVFGQYQSVAGIYTDTIPVAWGCDSVVTQELMVNQPVTHTLTAIHICPGDSALIFGHYEHIAGNYSMTLTGGNHCDSTVIQPLVVSSGNNYTTDTIGIRLCPGDSTLINGQWISQAGQYHLFHNIAGCDSIFHLYDVYQTVIDTNVTISGNSLVVAAGYNSYLWIDCATGNPAPGTNNNHVYTPTVFGNYMVEITFENCTVTSDCHAAGPTSIETVLHAESSLKVFPNPATTQLKIQMPEGIANGVFTLYDLSGKALLSKSITTTSTFTADLTSLAPGSYIVMINSGEKIFRTVVLVTK